MTNFRDYFPLNRINTRIKRIYALYLANYVFVHINKNGGSSIAEALGLPQQFHYTALEYKQILGNKHWNERFKFTFVRNPWDKVVSQYHYTHGRGEREIKDGDLDFTQWIKLKYGSKIIGKIKHPKRSMPELFLPQINWITDENGKIIVDFIGRFENIEKDFLKVCEIIGKEKELPHLRKSNHKPYTYYYNEETREIIRKRFQKDIEIFGYKF